MRKALDRGMRKQSSVYEQCVRRGYNRGKKTKTDELSKNKKNPKNTLIYIKIKLKCGCCCFGNERSLFFFLSPPMSVHTAKSYTLLLSLFYKDIM